MGLSVAPRLIVSPAHPGDPSPVIGASIKTCLAALIVPTSHPTPPHRRDGPEMTTTTTDEVQARADRRSSTDAPRERSRSREGRSSLRKRLSLSRATKGMRRVFRSSASQEREGPVLEYYDVAVFGEDMEAIKDDWLTDTAIEFWQEYLERERLPMSKHGRQVALLRPSIAFLFASIAAQAGEVDDSLLPDGFLDAAYVFVPVTDNSDLSKAGGSHWSLMLFGVREEAAYYMDSLPTSRGDKFIDTHQYCKAMCQIFGRRFRPVLVPTPKQANGSDCGVHVLMETDIVLDRIMQNMQKGAPLGELTLMDEKLDASAYRQKLLDHIDSLARTRGRKIGTTADVAISPERRSTSRARASIDQRMRQEPIVEETILEDS